MFRRLVPRHQAKVAATTWTRKTAAATARQKRRRNASGRVNRSPRVNPKENPSRSSEPVGGPQRPEQRSEVPEHKRTRHDAQEERSIRKYGNCQLVHCPHQDASECSGPVGGTDTGWLAEEVENLAPSIVAPGNRRSPTIRPITKLTKNCPADSGLLVQGTEVPEERGEYLQKCRSFGRRPRKGKQSKHNPTNQRQGQTSQKHQLPTRRATATSRHNRARPESLESGPTSLPRGSWNVMPAATWKQSQTTQVTRFLGRLPASCWDGRPVPGVGWSFCVGYR